MQRGGRLQAERSAFLASNGSLDPGPNNGEIAANIVRPEVVRAGRGGGEVPESAVGGRNRH